MFALLTKLKKLDADCADRMGKALKYDGISFPMCLLVLIKFE